MSIITYKNKTSWNRREKELVTKYTKKYNAGGTFDTGHIWLIVQIMSVLASLTLLLLVIMGTINLR
jgi:hypothetical protein